LTDERRSELARAHQQLRVAVEAYEEYLGGALAPGQESPVFNATEVGEAQRRVEEAEQELWRLREAYLGWARPAWAPSAAFEADWFSSEDAIYDEVKATPIC
jgi:mRNA-degrading endonuclease toxin of MazEF toxin-antitoxin module